MTWFLTGQVRRWFNRLGRWLVAAGAALVALVTFGAVQRRKGAKTATDRISRRAEAAAEGRDHDRQKIDRSLDAERARDRLRNRWTDDE